MHTTAPRRLGSVGILLILVLVIPSVLLAGCSGRVSDRSIEPIAQADAQRRLDEKSGTTLFLDARDPEAFSDGHIPGARRTGLSEIDLMDDRPRFGAWDLIVVYGQDPGSATARALVKRLLQTNHKNVALLEGGFAGWERAGLPVER
ncbi:MAG: hypothetical protein Tsb0013_21930 [Phycisphaerales bacterium]